MFTQLFSRTSKKKNIRHAPKPRRLCFDVLEERTLLSATLIDLNIPINEGSSIAWDVNNRGEVVGFTDYHAYLYRQGEVQYLCEGRAHGINDLGQVVGYTFNSEYMALPFLYDYNTGVMRILGEAWIPYGINNLGEIVGADRDGDPISYNIHTGVTTDLGSWWSAYGINDQGLVVGISLEHTVLYDLRNGTRVDYNFGYYCSFAINNLGQIVGNYYTGESYIYDHGDWTFLGTDINATGINDMGQVCGYDYDFRGVVTATPKTIVQLESSVNPSVEGEIVTLSATIYAGAGMAPPTGMVTFMDGDDYLGETSLHTLDGETTASWSSNTLAAGDHSITAIYLGDDVFDESASAALVQTVGENNASISLAVNANRSTYGQTVWLTAAVTAASDRGGLPSGTVTFFAGDQAIGTVALVPGGGKATASLSYNALAAGIHGITAVYSGDEVYEQIVSDAALVDVAPAVLTVQAQNARKTYGAADPVFWATFSGFVLGEGVAQLDGNLQFHTGEPLYGHAPVGNYAITAFGLSSANYNIVYRVGVLSVTRAALTITADNKTIVYGQPLPRWTASYQGFASGDTPASLTAQVKLTTTAKSNSPAGFYQIVASGAASPNYAITYVNGTLTIAKASTTTKITSSAATSIYGKSVTLSAVVAAVAPSAATPAGKVVFMEGATILGTATLNSKGTATLKYSKLTAGSHTITAVYQGGANFTASTSTNLVHQVLTETKTTLAASSKSSVYGQPVVFTATVSATAKGAVMPTGKVTFMDGNIVLGTANLVGGKATFGTAALGLGIHKLTAVYSGDAGSVASTSGSLSFKVDQAATSTTLVAAPGAAVYGQQVALTATVQVVAPGVAPIDGTVTFKDGRKTLGQAPLRIVDGQATATLNTTGLAVGNRSITAVYSGGNFAKAGKSAAVKCVVAKAPTTATYSDWPSDLIRGQKATFTVVVAVAAPGGGLPTGKVTFSEGGKTLGSATLKTVGGLSTAVWSTTKLAVGTHQITAVYTGSGSLLPSAGVLVQVAVK